jgi:nitric oxide dioxygenase
MLSAVSKPYIDASVPVLREHGVAITTAFYHNLFVEYPALKNLFNMGNQANGAQQQSLAAAVFAYAANISNPEVLTPVISRIVHKHVSLGILPVHYPIVGRHLLGAIKEVLGDAATQPLLDAWAEAYGLLADTLIAYEKALYERSLFNQAESKKREARK